jgi:hypothetical protein
MVFEEALRPIGNIAYILHIRTHWLRDTGGCMSPFAAFLTLLGLETLHLRMERHCKNALDVWLWLQQQKAVEWVNYPSLTIISHETRAASRTAPAPSSASASRAAAPPGSSDRQPEAGEPPRQHRRRETLVITRLDHPLATHRTNSAKRASPGTCACRSASRMSGHHRRSGATIAASRG